MTTTDHLKSLNPAQCRAVEYGISADASSSPPLLIIAGAGSGKTNTLAHRVAHLILNGADPSRILLLTFTRRAALEMTRRVERICAATLNGMAMAARGTIDWAGTFHAVGSRLLRYHAASIGLDPGFTILDREDAADLMNLVRDELGLSGKKSRFPKKSTCLAIYSYAVNAQTSLDEILTKVFPWCDEWEGELKRLFGAYVEAKQRQHVMDYDDLLLYWAQLVQVPELARLIVERFDHVLVDEYQDTNRLQVQILLGLKPTGDGVTVVGDDAQAIYSFRAATVRNILDFPSQFSPKAEVITLEQNYRSTEPILAASNAVIGQASERFTKAMFSERRSQQRPFLVTVRDETDQAGYVVDTILTNYEAGVALRQQAVLFRTSSHSGPLELELARRNIPFVKYGGLKFLEAAHIKDLLAVLRWAENPRDRVAGFRVLQFLPGIGPAIARRVLDQLETAGFSPKVLVNFRPPPAAAEDWPAFIELMALLWTTSTDWAGQLALLNAWYQPHLERLYDSIAARLSDLEQLERIGAGYQSRQGFLAELTLDPPEATSDRAGAPLLDEDYLILSTIHSAKGQEWRAVYILNVTDGCIPSDLAAGSTAEIEEERRLLYVAMTRAKDDLHLIHPLRFFTHQQRRHGDRHVYALRTRFIPSTILDRFECGTSPSRERPASVEATPRVDLAQRMRDAWR